MMCRSDRSIHTGPGGFQLHKKGVACALQKPEPAPFLFVLHQVCGRTSLRHAPWRRFLQQCRPPLRGGVHVQCVAVGIDVIIEDVLEAITAVRHGLSVRSLEIPAVQVVFCDSKSTLVHQAMMARAQQQQVIETGLTAG